MRNPLVDFPCHPKLMQMRLSYTPSLRNGSWQVGWRICLIYSNSWILSRGTTNTGFIFKALVYERNRLNRLRMVCSVIKVFLNSEDILLEASEALITNFHSKVKQAAKSLLPTTFSFTDYISYKTDRKTGDSLNNSWLNGLKLNAQIWCHQNLFDYSYPTK